MDMALNNSVTTSEIETIMNGLGARAKEAARHLASAPASQKNKALSIMAEKIEANLDLILTANQKDVQASKEAGKDAAFIDRLELNPDRIKAMANGLREIALLDDPVGKTLATWERPNGLEISRVQVPLGVIGIIYESRPNVTADAGGLCLKAGNAAILRGLSLIHI